MKWLREPKIEHHMKRLGLEWKIEPVEIGDIDLEESLNRQTRVGKKINEDWVMDFAIAMSAPGAAFPMCILNRIEKPKLLWVWSGLHRTHAAKYIGETKMDAYVLNVTEQRMADILPRVVNAWEGHGLVRDERLQHAKYLIDTYRLDTKEVCDLLNIKPEQLTAYQRNLETAQKISEGGIKIDGLSKTIITRLAPLMDKDVAILREASRFIVKTGLAGEEAYRFIEDVKRQDTSAKRMTEIERWRDKIADLEPKKRPAFKTELRRRFLRDLYNLDRDTAETDTLAQLQITEAIEVDNVFKAWYRVDKRMRHILKAEAAKQSLKIGGD